MYWCKFPFQKLIKWYDSFGQEGLGEIWTKIQYSLLTFLHAPHFISFWRSDQETVNVICQFCFFFYLQDDQILKKILRFQSDVQGAHMLVNPSQCGSRCYFWMQRNRMTRRQKSWKKTPNTITGNDFCCIPLPKSPTRITQI